MYVSLSILNRHLLFHHLSCDSKYIYLITTFVWLPNVSRIQNSKDNKYFVILLIQYHMNLFWCKGRQIQIASLVSREARKVTLIEICYKQFITENNFILWRNCWQMFFSCFFCYEPSHKPKNIPSTKDNYFNIFFYCLYQ